MAVSEPRILPRPSRLLSASRSPGGGCGRPAQPRQGERTDRSLGPCRASDDGREMANVRTRRIRRPAGRPHGSVSKQNLGGKLFHVKPGCLRRTAPAPHPIPNTDITVPENVFADPVPAVRERPPSPFHVKPIQELATEPSGVALLPAEEGRRHSPKPAQMITRTPGVQDSSHPMSRFT